MATNNTTMAELTFEEVLLKATEVADARTKASKQFLAYAKDTAIPAILKANKELGYRYLEVWHDTSLFDEAKQVGDGEMTYKFSTRFWSDEESFGIVDSANSIDITLGGTEYKYSSFRDMNLAEAKFSGMLKVLPLLLKELKNHIAKREKETQEALSLIK